jgi:hypothetical protein
MCNRNNPSCTGIRFSSSRIEEHASCHSKIVSGWLHAVSEDCLCHANKMVVAFYLARVLEYVYENSQRKDDSNNAFCLFTFN